MLTCIFSNETITFEYNTDVILYTSDPLPTRLDEIEIPYLYAEYPYAIRISDQYKWKSYKTKYKALADLYFIRLRYKTYTFVGIVDPYIDIDFETLCIYDKLLGKKFCPDMLSNPFNPIWVVE